MVTFSFLTPSLFFLRKRIFVDTVSTNKSYAVDTVSTNENYAVDTLGAPCTKEHFALKVNFELKVHFVL